MPKKNKIKSDTILKIYWNNNEQFADLFNAVLFEGNQIIKPNELKVSDTEASTIIHHKEYAQSIQQSRDIIKIQKTSTVYGVQFVLLGLENQEHIHYAMPLRVMGYDYSTYKKQYDSNARKYKTEKGLSQNEYLSKMKKTDKFTPVITVVIYYGETAWDGAISLHEMLHIPNEMKQYINNYKMLLVEVRKNDLKLHNINNVDFFNMMQILTNQNQTVQEIKDMVIAYAKEHHVDQTVVTTVASASNCSIDYHLLGKKEGDAGMLSVFEKTKKEGEVKGKAEGIIDLGLELGLSEQEIIEKLQQKLNIPIHQAKEYFNTLSKGIL